MAINSIENLSNGIFYEIFDYLDGIDICNAFTNLNYRFQQRLDSSSLLFKIKFGSMSTEKFTNNYKQFLLVSRNQIFSIYLCVPSSKKNFFSSFIIDSSFDRLESLVLKEIEPTILSSFLPSLTCLPRLFSLTIDTTYTLKELIDIYRLIFALPKLRYIKCSAEESYRTVSPPIITNKQFSTIEHLVVDHSCTFSELVAVIFHLPRLAHLNCMDLYNNEETNIRSVLPIRLFNLTNVSLSMNDITFDEFEIFITRTCSKLKVLRVITRSNDMDFLDANRWERMISRYLPQLEKFYFQYYKPIDPESGALTYPNERDRFTSPFWIQRKWILEAEMDSFEVVYSIHPYKKRWYDVNSSNESSKSARFILTHLPRNEELVLLMMNIRDMLTEVQVYHLEIPRQKVFYGTLIDLMYSLRALESLKIHSLSLSNSRYSSVEEKDFSFISNKNKITKVCLETMMEIEEVYFLIKLCPRMNYLQVNCINNMDVEIFLRDILSKINNQCNQFLRFLCFRVPTVDDKMVQRLNEMISSKKLLSHYIIKRHYTIKRVCANIYLQWD